MGVWPVVIQNSVFLSLSFLYYIIAESAAMKRRSVAAMETSFTILGAPDTAVWRIEGVWGVA